MKAKPPYRVMQSSFYGFVSAFSVSMALAGCGGGGNGGDTSLATIPGTNVSPSSPAAPSMPPTGTSVTLQANQSIDVPSGATITSLTGSVVSVQGHGNTIHTEAGAIISIPTTATGASDNLVTDVAASTTPPVPTAATVTVLAGSATTNLSPVDGVGTQAIFWGGGHLAMNASGDIIVSDRGALRKVTQAGVVTTLQSNPIHDWEGIAVDASGNIFGSGNGVDVAVNPVAFGASLVELTASGVTSTLLTDWEIGGTEEGVFDGFGGMAVGANGSLFLADQGSNKIYVFAPSSPPAVLAGSGATGNTDGIGSQSTFALSTGDMPIDANGNLYVLSGQSIRRVSASGSVSTVVGNLPVGGGALARDATGNFYVGQSNTVYRIDATGSVSAYASLGTDDFITSMTADSQGNVYVGTRGLGAQIFKLTHS